jgi:hypothetical protein
VISAEAELGEMEKERKLRQQHEQQLAELREAFMAREIHPEVIDRVNRAVRIAAEQGQTQLQVLTFPSSYCTDGGRRINIGDPEWPSTLVGFAKKAYDYFDKELRPLGYKIHAEIISFPGGMPGEVGLFLKW